MIRPDPRQRAERHFQRAGPIDSAIIGIRREPAFQLRANFVQVRVIASEQNACASRHQMLMPIRFPDHFVIAAVAWYPDRECGGNSRDRFPLRWIDRGARGFPGRCRWSGPGWEIDACRICSARRITSLGVSSSLKCAGNGSGSGSLMRGLEVWIKLHFRRPRVLVERWSALA